MTVETLSSDVMGTQFVRELSISETAKALRNTTVPPGMVSYLERSMLMNLVAKTWRGDGAIIDGGSFFGSSIVALADGIRANEAVGELDPAQFPGGKPIHGYERGYLPYTERERNDIRSWQGITYRAGEGFVPILEKAVEPYPDLVQLHIGDLNEDEWSHGAPIEVAFIDVCKTVDLNAHVSRQFYPALIPGGSTLITRDFFTDSNPWIKVTMGHLKDHFSWEGQVQSCSIYRTVQGVPADVAAYDPLAEASYEECLALHDAVEFPGLNRKYELRMQLSRAHLMTLMGHQDDALDTLKEIESTYADLLGDNDAKHGERSRFDRAAQQITSDTTGVPHIEAREETETNVVATGTNVVERLHGDMLGSQFVQDLDALQTAGEMRNTEVAPGMLSYLERSLIMNLVARRWRGEGAIIDGGSFFGSSIVALADGIRANEAVGELDPERFPDGKPIHGYELGFLPLPEGWKEQVRVWQGVEYRFGESFVPILEKAVEPYSDLIQLHIGDLNQEKWPHDAPIEVAFIDVCKTIDLNAHVSKEFYPALIPGGSTLINQDFFFDRLPWIKVTMGHLKDYFSWEGHALSSSVYRTVKAVPPDVAAYDPFEEASYEECLALHDAVEFPGLSRKYHFRMQLSRAYLMTLKGHKDDALDTLKELESTYADVLGDEHIERGQQFRFDRAVRQISNDNIFSVVRTDGGRDPVANRVAATSRELLRKTPEEPRPIKTRSGLKPSEGEDGWGEGDWLHGWAWDREDQERILHVAVARDGVPLLLVPADATDPSLEDVPGRGAHAYRIPVLAEFLTGGDLQLTVWEAGRPVYRGLLQVSEGEVPRLQRVKADPQRKSAAASDASTTKRWWRRSP